MDPVTIAALTLAATAVGGGVAAYGAHEQGVAAANQANYQAAVARNNQQIANQYAQAETQKGQILEEQKRQETQQREGAIRAGVGAAGLDVNSGSPLRLQTDTAMLGEQDAQTIRNNAARAAYGYQVEGMNYGARAVQNDAEAANAARSGALGMWSSIIGGAASTGSRWSQYRRDGVFGG